MITHVDVAFLHVARLAETVRWYQDVLGLGLGYGDASWQEFALPEAIPARLALDAPGDPPSEVERQSIMISLGVDDIRAEVERLLAAGVEFHRVGDGFIMDVGPTWVATFRDPEGNWLQLSQRKRS